MQLKYKVLLGALIALCTCAHVLPVFGAVSEEILSLTHENLQSNLYSYGTILVLFWSPDCLHCRNFGDSWKELANALKGKVTMARINVVAEKQLADVYRVKRTPAIYLFRSDAANPLEYTGTLTPEAIIKFVFRKTDPIIILTTKEEVDDFVATWDTSVIGFFEDTSKTTTSRSPAWKGFRECAKHEGTVDFGFGLVMSPALAKEYQIHMPNAMLFRKWEKGGLRPGPSNWKNFCDWAIDNGTPVVEEFNAKKYTTHTTETVIPAGLLFLDPSVSRTENEKLVNELNKLTTRFQGQIKIFLFNDGTQQTDNIISHGGTGQLPTFIIRDVGRKQNFAYDDTNMASKKFTAEKLVSFIQMFFDKKLEPKIKSTPENPSANWAVRGKHHHHGSHVQQVTGKNFREIVLDRTKDVIVEFYSPQCSHCKNFAPRYEALGEALCDVETVVVAAIDMTTNDIPYDIYIGALPSYPAIKLFPATSKTEPIDFNATPTVYDLLIFVFQEASIPFDIPEDIDLAELEAARVEQKERTKALEEVHTHTPSSTSTKTSSAKGFGYKIDTMPPPKKGKAKKTTKTTTTTTTTTTTQQTQTNTQSVKPTPQKRPPNPYFGEFKTEL